MEKRFQFLSHIEQLELPEEVNDWLHSERKKKGVHEFQHQDQNYLLISLGMRPNPGFQAEVVEVIENQEEIQIKVEEKKPDPNRIYPQMVVYPYVLGASSGKVQIKVKD
ncbi:protease complex subunit PrcB family protein [Risungbinella massiliensis]|uniref:protease complex subunit PrcB family protein n=1 Tax=Risungbinella massiliensis TaxID=1329796 RepID=UPI0005CBAB54|nr:protease complex subunit PrcB family protein [Risungbinella massiliensis]